MKNRIILGLAIFCIQYYSLSDIVWGYEYSGRRWNKNSMPTFKVNQVGTPDCSEEFQAIQNAIQTWNNTSTTYNNFAYGGTTLISVYGRDNVNLITWIESNWSDSFSSSAIAVAVTWYYGSQTLETDICFNGENHTWSDNGAAGTMDVQNFATHELGHSVGLADLYESTDAEKTMYGYGTTGETKKRTLTNDDEDGTRYIYFNPQLSGTVTENQIWQANVDAIAVALSWNLSIPTNYSVTISSNYAANLNGYALLLNGGSLVIQTAAH